MERVDKHIESGTLRSVRTGGTSPGCGNPPVPYVHPRGILELLAEHHVSIDDSTVVELLYEKVPSNLLASYASFARRAVEGRRNPTVTDINGLWLFDKQLQSEIFKAIRSVELQIKAQYCNHMTQQHGKYCLNDPELFHRRQNHRKSVALIRSSLGKHSKSDPAIRAALEPGALIPFDMAIRWATFGTVVHLLKNTKADGVLEGVAASFRMKKSVLVECLGMLCETRNACAHFDAFAVRAQVHKPPRSLKEFPGDNTKPLHILKILEVLLEGRDSYLGDSSGNEALRFRSSVRTIIGNFANMKPDLAAALYIPTSFMPYTLITHESFTTPSFHVGEISYCIVSLAA